jgi:hypothetical protein
MSWGHVFSALGLALGAAAFAAYAASVEEKQQVRLARRQKRWDQRLKDEARRAQQAEDTPVKEAERLRLQAEADARKRLELVAQYEPTRAYWREWLGELGEDQMFLFVPPSIPEKQGFDAFVLAVEDLGLRVEKLDHEVVFVPFEGLKAVLKQEDKDEDEDDENED